MTPGSLIITKDVIEITDILLVQCATVCLLLGTERQDRYGNEICYCHKIFCNNTVFNVRDDEIDLVMEYQS